MFGTENQRRYLGGGGQRRGGIRGDDCTRVKKHVKFLKNLWSVTTPHNPDSSSSPVIVIHRVQFCKISDGSNSATGSGRGTSDHAGFIM